MWIGSEWWLPSWADRDIDPLRTPMNIVGGHQVLTKGWVDHDKNTQRNSWSEAWANHGEANYSYAAWRPYIREAWTIADIPDDARAFLAHLPAASDFHYRWDNNLHYGDDSKDVKELQCALMITGFLTPIAPDEMGHYGIKTTRAVGAYQRSKGIYPAPDSVGPQTRKALNAQFVI